MVVTDRFDSAERRWQAVEQRHKAADGSFVFAVATTGVYCRPSCGARAPLRKNVMFFDTPAAAAREGYRACRRCRPNEVAGASSSRVGLLAACRLIEKALHPLEVATLAAAAGMSVAHFHRQFKARVGVTPQGYVRFCRANHLRHGLAGRASVTIPGIHSPNPFNAGAPRLGPAACRAGGWAEIIQYAIGPCDLGIVLVAATSKGICAITLGDDARVLIEDLKNRFPRAAFVAGGAEFPQSVAEVIAAINMPGTAPELSLDIRGTVFQQRVWAALRAIPSGETRTYAQIAVALGRPAATRAVAGACGANSLAVVIPCHRVVRSDGTLSGYRWGVPRKAALLAKERQ